MLTFFNIIIKKMAPSVLDTFKLCIPRFAKFCNKELKLFKILPVFWCSSVKLQFYRTAPKERNILIFSSPVCHKLADEKMRIFFINI